LALSLSDVPIDNPLKLIDFINTLGCSEIQELLEEGIKLLDPGPQQMEELPTIFHGDLHGDVVTVYELWKKVGLDRVLNDMQLVFLGDYVDRGPNQIEALILPLALKARRPERVTVLRGNHEPPPWLPVSPHDYPEVLRFRCGPELGFEVYSTSLKLFDKMPLFALVDGYVGLHGGPPFSKLRTCKGTLCLSDLNEKQVEEVLWSDPDELLGFKMCSWDDPLETCVSYDNPRGAGAVWGAGATREFLERVGAEKVVRGHTAVDGLAYAHGDKLITLFTRSGAPYYNSKASILLIQNGEEKAISVEVR